MSSNPPPSNPMQPPQQPGMPQQQQQQQQQPTMAQQQQPAQVQPKTEKPSSTSTNTAKTTTTTPSSTTPGSATTASAGGTPTSTATAAAADAKATTTNPEEPADQAVIDYLRKKGMGTAALELAQILKQQGKSNIADDSTSAANKKSSSLQQQLEDDDRKTVLAKATGGGFGYDRDAVAPVVQWGVPDKTVVPKTTTNLADRMGVDEAKSLLDAFTSFQLWVLSLPEHDGLQTVTENPILKAQQLIQDKKKSVSLSSVVETLNQSSTSNTEEADKTNTNSTQYHLPPSAKPELFAVAFALLVHTYCELLEVGIESTALTLRDTFKSVYEPLYAKEYADLYQCNTTEDIMRLNSHNAQHMESLAALKGVLVNISSFQQKRDELRNAPEPYGQDNTNRAAKQAKLQEYDRTITMLQQKYDELSRRASLAFSKMHDLPFLRRARAVRWQLSMSTATYSLLSGFLNASDTRLLAMSALLQTKCELHVERRDPLPFTPACVLDDNGSANKTLQVNKSDIAWAAPMPRTSAAQDKLPFPKFHLEDEYDDEAKAQHEKKLVEFNRALLVNGFRRLEALERKQEYECLPKLKIAKEDYHHHASSRETANALEPTILMNTLCSTASTSSRALPSRGSSNNNASLFMDLWEESGIGLTCAKICPPDARQVAVGCDDAAVRIWNLMGGNNSNKEPAQVLLGHKNGFPVFDVSWNRDGRTLLSAAGDGSVRLWDTHAVGYFGETASIKASSTKRTSKAAAAAAAAAAASAATDLDDMNVPGLKTEDSDYASGAALAVYRGHAPNTPIWSVQFAPCGYYFASAGADATVRLWTTDREVPVRLFTGHTSMIVNCVDWHPNCNYIISGSEDKTARLWDIHSGRTVRLLNGCSSGINAVKISPCGKYAAGADGLRVHIWDMGSGKKVTEFRNKRHHDKGRPPVVADISMIHTMSFSSCGSALATGGDDGCVRIWDIRHETVGRSPVVELPVKSFSTRQSIIMDLNYNKRNLLLAVGKYATPVPAPAVIVD